MISRHITFEHCTDPIPRAAATDPAFVDALIDVRNVVVGPEVETLNGFVDRYQVVEALTARLESRFPPGRRLRASVALAELGDRSSATVLMSHLADPEPEIRIQSARGLGRIQWTPAIDVIVARFNFETSWVRSRFGDALIGFGRKATWPLVAYIKVNHSFESAGPATAIRTLASIGDDEAVSPLMEVLQDADDPEVQIATIEALGSLGGPLAVDLIQKQCLAGDWRLRAKAASALGEIGDRSSISILSRGLRDLNWWVRRNSASALAQVPGGIEVLYSFLNDDDPYAGDAAAEALGDAGELVTARRRIESGGQSERDYELLDYMAATGVRPGDQ